MLPWDRVRFLMAPLFLLGTLLFFLLLILKRNRHQEQEKLSPFECGFNPLKRPRGPLSLRFFFLSLIFLILDVEIIVFLPGLVGVHSFSPATFGLLFFFGLSLILGFYFEWFSGSVEWRIESI